MTEKTGEERKPKGEKATGLSQEDIEAAFSGPAVASNRFFVTLGASGARIAFTEQNPGIAPQFRTAVILPYDDAIELADLLERLLDPIREQFAAAKSGGQGDG